MCFTVIADTPHHDGGASDVMGGITGGVPLPNLQNLGVGKCL